MKVINGKVFLTIGEVSKIIDRNTHTIKNWYEWYDQNEEAQKENLLPEIYRELDNKRTRYFLENDIEKLINFRDKIKYGFFNDFNTIKWGRRGKEIMENKRRKNRRKKELFNNV